MHQINRDLVYLISENCRIQTNSVGKISTIRGEDLSKMEEEYELDNRFRLVSFKTTKDMVTYANYFSLFARLTDIESSKPENFGRFVSMLDMGYVPVIAAPSFMGDSIYSQFQPLLSKSGVEIREMKPMRIDGRTFDSKSSDVWASRIDIAKFMNCDITEVSPVEFLKEVVRRCV